MKAGKALYTIKFITSTCCFSCVQRNQNEPHVSTIGIAALSQPYVGQAFQPAIIDILKRACWKAFPTIAAHNWSLTLNDVFSCKQSCVRVDSKSYLDVPKFFSGKF